MMENAVRPHIQTTQAALHKALSLFATMHSIALYDTDLKPQHVSEVHGPFIIHHLAILLTVP